MQLEELIWHLADKVSAGTRWLSSQAETASPPDPHKTYYH